MSDFAKAQLLKYGWTEGKGLGKNENGIAEALKPKLKFDKSGVGHKDLDFEWWDSIYNKALKNIVLDKKTDEICINVVKENAFNISSTKSGLDVPKKTNSLCYGKFLKTSTLKDGNIIKDSTFETMEDEIKDDVTVVKLSDEELFKACGGRTAHKGARHGLNLSGKLARVAEQEKQLLSSSLPKSVEESLGFIEIKSKRKKKSKNNTSVENNLSVVNEGQILKEDQCKDDLTVLSSELLEENYVPPVRTSRKVRKKIRSLTHQLTKSCMIQDQTIPNKKNISNLTNQLTEHCTIQESSLKNDKKSFENSTNILNDEIEEKIKCRKRKAKKSKHKSDPSDIITKAIDNLFVDNVHAEPRIKKSRNMKTQILEPVSESSSEYDQVNDTLRKIKKDKRQSLSKVFKHNYCTSTAAESERLNLKIKSRKNRKHAKKVAKKLAKLSEGLLAVSLDTDTNEEIKTEFKKKRKNKNKQKSLINDDLKN